MKIRISELLSPDEVLLNTYCSEFICGYVTGSTMIKKFIENLDQSLLESISYKRKTNFCLGYRKHIFSKFHVPH